VSEVVHDEPGSRTRHAWLRTALGMVAVTILIERGLALRGLPLVLGLVALAPATALVAVAIRRSAELGPHDSAGPSRPAIALTSVAVIGLAVAALASVLGR
jgi:uncharacterized membrane protein YidH (DUF202 family)